MRDVLNCPNCGAPIQSDICPYCGSVFLDWSTFDLNRPTFVKVRDFRNGHVKLLKLGTASVEEEISMEHEYLYADNVRHAIRTRPDYIIRAEFNCYPFTDPFSKKEIYCIDINPEEADQETIKSCLEVTK